MTHETNTEQVRKLRDEIIAGRLSYKPALLGRAIERFADALEEAGRVDLEQFREAVSAIEFMATFQPKVYGERLRTKAQELRRLINSQKDR